MKYAWMVAPLVMSACVSADHKIIPGVLECLSTSRALDDAEVSPEVGISAAEALARLELEAVGVDWHGPFGVPELQDEVTSLSGFTVTVRRDASEPALEVTPSADRGCASDDPYVEIPVEIEVADASGALVAAGPGSLNALGPGAADLTLGVGLDGLPIVTAPDGWADAAAASYGVEVTSMYVVLQGPATQGGEFSLGFFHQHDDGTRGSAALAEGRWSPE